MFHCMWQIMAWLNRIKWKGRGRKRMCPNLRCCPVMDGGIQETRKSFRIACTRVKGFWIVSFRLQPCEWWCADVNDRLRKYCEGVKDSLRWYHKDGNDRLRKYPRDTNEWLRRHPRDINEWLRRHPRNINEWLRRHPGDINEGLRRHSRIMN